jgi:hypothetical protein
LNLANPQITNPQIKKRLDPPIANPQRCGPKISNPQKSGKFAKGPQIQQTISARNFTNLRFAGLICGIYLRNLFAVCLALIVSKPNIGQYRLAALM